MMYILKELATGALLFVVAAIMAYAMYGFLQW